MPSRESSDVRQRLATVEQRLVMVEQRIDVLMDQKKSVEEQKKSIKKQLEETELCLKEVCESLKVTVVDDDEEDVANNGGNGNECAACGGEGEDLKTCNARKMVKYCNATCEKRHRPEHRQKCQERAAQMFDEKLFADPSPKIECPICFLPMPYGAYDSIYQACCGKTICAGCRGAAVKAVVDAVTRRSKNLVVDKCAFCRVEPSEIPPEAIGDQNDLFIRLKKRMSAGDAEAFRHLGEIYSDGMHGFPHNQNATKAFELFSKSADLGSMWGRYNLALAYADGEGVGTDLVKAKYHYELAAIGGNDYARYNLGIIDFQNGNFDRAMKHWMISAMRGLDEPLENLKKNYIKGYLSKDDLEKALLAHKASQDDMKSEHRDWVKYH